MGFYKSTLGIESPEPGEAPAATGQLKRMVEQIDALLRKQLTKLVELAKLKVTETIELPAESIVEAAIKALAVTTAKIAAEAVTAAKIANGAVTDAKITAGRALVETENKYIAKKLYSKAEAEAGVEPSATRSAMVTLYDGSVFIGVVTVGGVELASVETAGAFTFMVPPGQKWVAHGSVFAATLLL